MGDWMQVREAIDNLLSEAHTHWPSPEAPTLAADVGVPAGERFASDVFRPLLLPGRARHPRPGVPVHLMRKKHKLQVVRGLEGHGLFEIPDGVALAAEATQVPRFTTYDYLNELHGAPPAQGTAPASSLTPGSRFNAQ